MAVRAARPEDLTRLVELERLCEGDAAWSENLVRDGLAGTVPSVSWLIEGRHAGYLVLSVTGDVAEVQRIGVDPAHRRGGLGRMLLGEAVRCATRAGAERLLLEVREDNVAAFALYREAGFAEIDRRARYYRDGANAVVMCLPLTKERD